MNIIQIYKQFPDNQACIKHLETVKWSNTPVCPYCKASKFTAVPKESRYHCNSCNRSFSVTVGTIFHNTKMDLQKWFLAVSLVLNAKKGISSRQLGRDLETTKDTAWRMQMQIRKSMTDQGDLLQGIIEADETYIGGKNKNRHNDKKISGIQGRSSKDKTPVIGLKQRDGKVIAKKSKDVSSKSLNTFINANVKEDSTLMTDEWRGYNKISAKFDHFRVSHSTGMYVIGEAHTNGIENFWSMLKRGIVGQYHNVSERHLNKYINEFCYRYNNRENKDLFNETMLRAVNL
jgi:transposase-like protein